MRTGSWISRVGVVLLVGVLGDATAALGQGMGLTDEGFEVVQANGLVESSLTRSTLKLGSNGGYGVLLVENDSGLMQFSTGVFNNQTEILGALYLVNPATLRSPLVLWGDSGDIQSSGDLSLLGDDAGLIRLYSETGTAENNLNGNGFVKAWAKIDSDGGVIASYNCDEDETKTLRAGPGIFYVDFNPVDADISGRPVIAVLNGGNGSQTISVESDAGDPSRVVVYTSADLPFTVTVF